MEPIEVDSASNRVGTHVWEHNPVPISEEGQGVLSDNGVQTITCWPKQGGPAVTTAQLNLSSLGITVTITC